ncbi:MAG: methyltransferase [Candidatus Cloacimonetes bacterium]|nr:methyltransferase [Candidatus Cloacimonadota bacterium]
MDLRPVALPFAKISILQDVESQAISSDSEFLYRNIVAEYSGNAEKPIKALELGTGNGIIAIMLALTFKNWQIKALEAQIALYLLAKKNISQSKTDIDLILTDFRKTKQIDINEKYDLIYSNPPFYSLTTVRISPSISKSLSRYELLCDMEDVLLIMKINLKKNGKGLFLYPTIRADEFRRKAEKHGFEIVNEQINVNKTQQENKSRTIFFISHTKRMSS